MAYNGLEEYLVPASYFTQGGLWSWGQNGYGQLGDNSFSGRSSPVQTIAVGTNWRQIACSDYHTVAIKTDGTLWLWGRNESGQLGTNNTSTFGSPVQTIAAGTNWKQADCSGSYTAAVKTDGTLWLWGSNGQGRLGTSNTTDRSSPVQTIAAGTNWKQVSCGAYHTAAVKTDGTLWSWGYGANGEMGNNSRTTVSSPVQTISAGTNWKLLSCGYYTTAAIKTDGTLWLWGVNDYGQLGDNTINPKSSPIQTVSGGNNWKQVAIKLKHVVGIKTDGTLWLWGQNSYGQLGTNNTVPRSSPVQTVAGGTNWKHTACGAQTSAAIKTDGTLWLWGRGTSGELGTGTTANASSPVQTVAAGTSWKFVSVGPATAAAINGTWGKIT